MSIELKYDGVIDIATGKSRHELKWKNQQITWSKLVEKLSKTTRTHEKYAVYLKSEKPRQDEIKDVGAFVGGLLTNGKRGKGSVAFRTLVTLDLDFAPVGFWEEFSMLNDYAACIYSTHKHAPDKPRLRLVIPLDRQVMADEYIAISRRIAGDLGIEYFDTTGHQPERLMYWPSTSIDGHFIFEYQDMPFLSADKVLGTYRDWKDSSEWPVSDRESEAVLRNIKKQGDPLEKPGVVGAFCRTHSISEVISEYLSDVYTECDGVEDRYTYINGSTAGGLVVYEDKFAFSHHGSDPVSEKLCNAFDLVRLHLFGVRDEKTYDRIIDAPSFKAMEDLARKDPQVRKLLVNEKMHDAQAEFANIEIDEDEKAAEVNDDWKSDLSCDKKGNIHSTVANIVILLTNAPELKNIFAFDEFRKRAILRRDTPWRKVTQETSFVTDTDEDVLYHHLESVYGITATKLGVALSVVYNKQKFHPVKDYLGKLKWDGTKRLDTLLIDYLGAEDTKYVKAVTRKTFTAAVARVYQPGIKFDTVLTLVGTEGAQKSTLFDKMGREWFSDSFTFSMIKNKTAIEQILGQWIVEIGEMSGHAIADTEEMKAFIARRKDTARGAYQRNPDTHYRQNIFVSTTNKVAFLRENNGNRRFWPVSILVNAKTKQIDVDLTSDEIDQLWAEAVQRYKAGEKIYLSKDMEAEAKIMQRSHTEEHPWTGIVKHFLDLELPEDWADLNIYERRAFIQREDPLAQGSVERDRVCLQELWVEAIGKNQGDMTSANARDLRGIMSTIDGWEEVGRPARFGRYGQQRIGYKKINVLVNA